MIIKSICYATTGLTFASLISETFYNKLDRNLIRPFRNFVEVMDDSTSFFMPEDV
jgi:hypothetical protein